MRRGKTTGSPALIFQNALGVGTAKTAITPHKQGFVSFGSAVFSGQAVALHTSD